jgi:hypothetical protein
MRVYHLDVSALCGRNNPRGKKYAIFLPAFGVALLRAAFIEISGQGDAALPAVACDVPAACRQSVDAGQATFFVADARL